MPESRSVLLPSRSAMQQAIDNGSPEDYHLVQLYYSWYAGWFYRQRLHIVNALLGKAKLGRILEIGVGSGIFLKNLLLHAETVTGVDIHHSYKGVQAMLRQENVDLNRVELRTGSIFDIPSPDSSFDAVVCISVLEHFEDPRPALREMKRVLKPEGFLALGFPARTSLTNSLFQALGYHAQDIHPSSHSTILAAINDTLKIEMIRYFPLKLFPMYIACKAR